MKFRYLIVLAISMLAFVALPAAQADTTPNIVACDGDPVCLNEWYANQEMSLPDPGPVTEPGWLGTTRYYNVTKYSGRGFSHEARRYSFYVRWRVVDNSRITGWWYGLQNTTGTACHLESYDTPYIYQGALGTSAIYVTSRAHFGCDMGWPTRLLMVHPDCWLNMRLGALGGVIVQSKGCDWV